jgi:hypothetical protein
MVTHRKLIEMGDLEEQMGWREIRMEEAAGHGYDNVSMGHKVSDSETDIQPPALVSSMVNDRPTERTGS